LKLSADFSSSKLLARAKLTQVPHHGDLVLGKPQVTISVLQRVNADQAERGPRAREQTDRDNEERNRSRRLHRWRSEQQIRDGAGTQYGTHFHKN
jgi:hypothetical protein